MVMQRWEPFRELRQMEDTMNRLWRGFGWAPAVREGGEDWNILIDVIQRADDIVVKASLPGVDPDAIDVAVEDNVLTLRAERKAEAVGDQEGYLIQERPTGSFYRALRLPETVNAEKIECSYDNGVLTITMPKAEEKKRKQIPVKMTGGSRTVDASSKK